ncbi:MAG: rod shape-determining protein MreC [Cardiobacteriaceae bacterium]|nr:rod shape-determining protein MreC [Cardiobacteriaceae bacterium]
MWFYQAPDSQSLPPPRLRPVLLLLFLAILLLVLSRQTIWLMRPYSWLHDGIYAPVRTVLHAPLRWTKMGLNQFSEHQDERALLLQQQQENQELRAQVQLLGHFQAENRRLRMLMDSLLNVTDPVLIAELSDTAIDGYHESVTINKGTQDGVYVNQAVIDPYGLVGQVVEVFAHESRVMLITDTRSRVPVYVARSQQRTLVFGSSGYGTLEMPPMRADSDIQVGDRLVSSGLGGIYPRGYPVAEVTAIERDTRATSLMVRLRPLAHLQSMLEVLLLDQRHITYPAQAVVPVGPPDPNTFSESSEKTEEPHAGA